MKPLLILALAVATVCGRSHYGREVERMKVLRNLGVDEELTKQRMAKAEEELKRQTGKKNVIWIAADDFRPQIQHYLDHGLKTFISPKMHTPNLDKLCRRSLVMHRHYVQQSICSPSRTSVITGRRPDSTRVYDLETYWREVGGNFTTIPQYFKENGYRTMGMGKILHSAGVSDGFDPLSWTDEFYFPYAGFEYYKLRRKMTWKSLSDDEVAKHPLPDVQTADKAIEWLDELAKNPDQPFFMAVGFIRPHLPFSAPKKYFDLYPMEDIKLPDNPTVPKNMPDMAWNGPGVLEVHHYLPGEYKGSPLRDEYHGAQNEVLPDQLAKEMRRAYYAGTSLLDDQVGRVLDKLEEVGLADNTIVAFWGDHGMLLQEHSHWSKMSTNELANQSPLIIAVPGRTDQGIDTKQLSESVDLFPTLVDAAGLPTIPRCPKDSSKVNLCTEGSSLIPLIDNPDTPIKSGAFSQYPKWILDGTGVFLPRYMGYSIRTDRYRYTEYCRVESDPEHKIHFDDNYGVEMYDHENDPEENVNIASENVDLAHQLSQQLRAGYLPARLNK